MSPDNSARDRLVSSAARLFHVRSYASVGIQDLCEDADVRRGSFYYYFDSKEALAEAVLEYEREDLIANVFGPAFSNGASPLEQFRSFIENIYNYQVNRSLTEGGAIGGCPIANLGQELGTEYEGLRLQSNEILESFTTIFATALQAAKDVGEVEAEVNVPISAARIRAYVQGVLEVAKLSKDNEVIRELGFDIRNLLAHDSASTP